MGWLCGVGVFGLIVFSLSPGLAQRTPIINNNNNNNISNEQNNFVVSMSSHFTSEMVYHLNNVFTENIRLLCEFSMEALKLLLVYMHKHGQPNKDYDYSL